jgi:hypothetical protein
MEMEDIAMGWNEGRGEETREVGIEVRKAGFINQRRCIGWMKMRLTSPARLSLFPAGGPPGWLNDSTTQ